MDFTQLPMNSTLIAPSHMHALIRKQIVKEKKGILGLRILSLSQFLTNYSNEDVPSMPSSLYQVKQKIQNIQEQLSTYHKIANTALFLEECYQFINDLRAQGIPLNFPVDTPAHKELHDILDLFQDIRMSGDVTATIVEKLKTMTFENIYILDAYQTLEHQAILDILIKNQAQVLKIGHTVLQKEFFHALNKRQEVEACAQYIITQQLCADDIHITLCDTSYQPLLKQLFERYHIPFTLLQEERNSLIASRVKALVQYVLYPDSEHILSCLDVGLFMRKGQYALREYLQLFELDFFVPFHHICTIQDYGNLFDTHSYEYLLKLETQAKAVQEELIPIFERLKNITTYDELLILILQDVKDTLRTQEDRSIYRQIMKLFQDIHSELQDKDDLLFLLSFLDDITLQEHASTYQGVLVHNLTSDMFDKKYHFVLGANQANYPAFQIKKGIFDEPYHALISNYPSMDMRYNFYQTQLNKLLMNSSHLYISYALGTYEGKSLESALEIEQFVGRESIAYPLHEVYQEIALKDTISEESALALFLHDGLLHGSISSFERYVKCPYSYFLRYGLALREPMKVGFPDSYAGTLSHYILETLTTTYGKAYTSCASEKIEQIITLELSKLQAIFPSMQDALINVKQRLQESMIETIAILADFEQHSTCSPTKCEAAFDYQIPLHNGNAITLHGYIDRIDESKEFACILDYKSSIKTLSEINVFAALQLQLVTYAMVIAKESGKEMLGAYYVSLKNETIPYPAGSLSRRKPVTHQVHTKEDMEKERRKARRFNGWTMHPEIATLDDNASHVVGLRLNKDGIVQASKTYDIHALEKYFTQMYQSIGHKILTGTISLTPQEDACMFCDYHEICRFKGFYKEKESLVEVDDDIYWKGEEEDA